MILKNLIICLLSSILLASCDIESAQYDLKDFAIKDTSSITKFRISDTEDNTVEITRINSDKIWKIGGTNLLATKASVDLIMGTFYRTRVKQDVPNSTFNTVINRLSVRYKKVEIFTKSDLPIKTWYIGSPTQDHLGTYMLLQEGKKKSSIPYITYKPGMYGSLDVRFFTGIENWRSTKVFSYANANKIKSIKVKFNFEPNQSFSIIRNENNVQLINGKNQMLKSFDTIQVKHYMTHFNNINYNKNMMFKESIRDSFLAIKPHIYFEVNDDINNKIINFWKIKDDNSETGWDKEYGLININNGKELMRVQYFNWEILFKPLSYFTEDITK
jgi:hypothetical protein